jgi:hypothetical protein
MRINTHCERAEATDFARLIHWRVAYFRVAAAAAANTAVAARRQTLRVRFSISCVFRVIMRTQCLLSGALSLCVRPPAKALLDEDKQLSGTRPKAAFFEPLHPRRDRRETHPHPPTRSMLLLEVVLRSHKEPLYTYP